jgi:dienelactone hydrolase
MIRTFRFAVAAAAALIITLPVTPPANGVARTSTASTPATELPEPTGPYPVGVTTVHLQDRNRPDPWVPERHRELMVSLWYPALRQVGRRAQYVTPAESALILRHLQAAGVPEDALSTTVTHARVDAPPLRRTHGLPLVVLSPGFSFPRTSLTGLAEDLASRGYAVAAIDHTYESAVVTFPDGRIVTCLDCRSAVDGPAVAAGRARDVSFVLDRLTRPRPVWRGARLIDAGRIAMVGHSIGGASATWTMRADARVRAGLNMDGSFQPTAGDVLYPPLDRPFLLLGAEVHGQPGADTSWDSSWSSLRGWRRWLSVEGTTHSSFTDYAVLGDQAGIKVQPLPGERCSQITRAYVAAFLDRHLRRQPRLLLNGPSARYPEVRFWGSTTSS